MSYSLKVVDRFEPGVSIPCEPGVGAYNYHKNAYRWKLQVVFPDGSAQNFRPVGHSEPYGEGFFRITANGQLLTSSYTEWSEPPSTACNTTPSQATTNPMVYYSTDGSFTRLVVDHDSSPGNFTGAMNDFTLYFPDGSKFENNEGRLTDRNGNFIEAGQFSYNGSTVNGIVDEFGRKLLSVPSGTPGESHLVQFGVNGEELIWTIRRKTVYVRRQFKTNEAAGLMERGGSSDQTWEFEHNVVSEILLPSQYGNLKYEFEYYASDTPITSGYSEGWGEIKSITMPTGAVAEYEYRNDAVIYAEPYTKQILENSVKKKTLKYLAEYDGASSQQEDVWTYTITHISATVTSPDGGQTTQSHGDTWYEHAGNGLVRSMTSPNGAKIEKIWSQNVPSGGGSAQTNPFVKIEFTSIKDANGNYTLTAIKEFTQDKNGNTASVKEYDFVPYANVPRTSGFPTGLPGGIGNPVRTIFTSYHNATPDSSDTSTDATYAYWNFGAVKGVVAATEIKNSANQTVSKSEINYDNYSTTANPTLTRAWDSTKGAVSSPLVDGNSVKTQATYNSYGMPLTSTDANGNVTSITYGNVTCPGGTVTDLYPTLTISADGTAIERTSSAVYDCYTGLTTSATDEDNDVTNAMEYDGLGRPVKSITADGDALESWTVTEYHDADRFVVTKADLETVGDGKKVAIQHFDQLGRVRLSRSLENPWEDPADETHGIKVETRYKSSGSCTFDANKTCSFQITSNPFRAATSSAATNEPTMGWTMSQSRNDGRYAETQTFSGAGLPASFGGSNSNSTGISKEESDANSETSTDEAGKKRRTVADALGRLVRVDEPDANGSLGLLSSPAQPTNYTYDTLGNLTQIVQGGQTRAFAYSSMSRLLSVNNPESGTFQYTYDNNGNLLTKTDSRTISTTYTYGSLNRVTFRNYSDSTPDITYTYDDPQVALSKGKLTKVASAASETSYLGYDAQDRITASRQRTDGIDYNFGYTYNLDDDLKTQTYPSGKVVSFAYDSSGDLSSVSGVTGQTNRLYANAFGYSAHGQVEKLRLGNGKWETTQFNSDRQIIQVGLGHSAANTGLWKVNYEYGELQTNGTIDAVKNNGNLARQTITVPTIGGVSGFTAIQSYTYDSLDRLKSAEEKPLGWTQPNCDSDPTKCWKQTFSYDRFGNKNFDTGNTTIQSVDSTTAKVVNPEILTSNNRFKEDQDSDSIPDYLYDLSGNITKNARAQDFTYDAENRQITATGTGLSTNYSYDPNGKRVKSHNAVNGQTTVFVYDASGLLAAEYTIDVPAPTNPTISYLTEDALGSVRVTTDTYGQLKARRDFLPFGEELYSGLASRMSNQKYSASADDTRKKFATYQRDIETGLDYAQSRYYSPMHGRFTSPDEFKGGPDELFDFEEDAADNPTFYADLTNPQSLNKYQYTYNNPYKFNDPDGHFPIWPWVVRGAIAVVTVAVKCARSPSCRDVIQEAVGAVTERVPVIGPLPTRRRGPVVRRPAPRTSKPDPKKRGKDSEKRVLKDEGLDKNTKKVSSKEGDSIPDSQNKSQVVEVKDTKKVTNTKQIRIQRQAAIDSKRKHTIITGRKTRVSKNAEQPPTRVKRRDDLGPQ